ncbi:MAG: hypothetical protein RLY31_423 [Bacteroidota bacterium]
MHKNASLPYLVMAVAIMIKLTACGEPVALPTHVGPEAASPMPIFPKGELGSPDLFTGKAWHVPLLGADSTLTTLVGNVYLGAIQHVA